jgi:hypothetical protein
METTRWKWADLRANKLSVITPTVDSKTFSTIARDIHADAHLQRRALVTLRRDLRNDTRPFGSATPRWRGLSAYGLGALLAHPSRKL